MTEVCDSTADTKHEFQTKKNRLVLNAKSLSLELARQKHRLAAQLVSNILSSNRANNIFFIDLLNLFISLSFMPLLTEC